MSRSLLFISNFFLLLKLFELDFKLFATCVFSFGKWVEDVRCFEKSFWKTIFQRLHIIIMSHTSFRVNLHYIVCLNVKELLAWSRQHIWSLSDRNRIRTHNHLVRKRTNDLNLKKASLTNGWVFVYEVNGFGLEPRCCHLNFRYGACFKQRVPWHSGKLQSVDSF